MTASSPSSQFPPAAAGSADPTLADPALSDRAFSDRAPRQVGIVDDDAAVRDSLHFLLDTCGYPAATFDSAADFLHRRDRERLAGVILDHHMPQMTGLELAARMRAAGETMPILLITGSLSPAIVARAQALGVEWVMEKPVAEAELLRFAATVAG